MAARTCDSCQSAPAAVYCRADAAYLCGACDAAVHGANPFAGRHERVRVCEVCERAPAAVFCAADAAFLCAECDVSVHSANPLAHRHSRQPVTPLCESAPVQPPVTGGAGYPPVKIQEEEDFGDLDRFFYDVDVDVDFSLSATSSSEAATVPDVGIASEVTKPTYSAVVAAGPDREARLMRYREKRNSRRFEKTIRYASRKAYAETRPRIKGRFAKREDAAVAPPEFIYLAADYEYAVVPSL